MDLSRAASVSASSSISRASSLRFYKPFDILCAQVPLAGWGLAYISNMLEATLVEAVVVDGDPDAPEVERQPAQDEAKHNSQYQAYRSLTGLKSASLTIMTRTLK